MCIKGGIFLPIILATTDPPRLTALATAFSKLRFGFASLAWSCPRYAISDGGFAFQSYNEFRTELKTDFPDAINVGDILSIEKEETVRV